MEWFSWAARAAGAGAVGFFGFSMLVATLMVSEGRLVTGSMAAAALAGAWFAWPRSPNAWRREPPSQKQLRYAADLGIRVRPGATKGEVSDAITRVTGR